MDMDLVDALGFLAAILVLLTFCMNSMTKLRLVALLSNVAFVAYGIAAELLPVMVLHGVLMPINATWLFQSRPGESEERGLVE
jgi:CRP/FNR family cyclic AMP-dependent transcriptional regulator